MQVVFLFNFVVGSRIFVTPSELRGGHVSSKVSRSGHVFLPPFFDPTSEISVVALSVNVQSSL